MKFLLFFSVIILAVTFSFSQNLITNPGFENDTTGWSATWARTTGAANRAIVTSPVHGGSKALRLQHHGTQDWSEQTQAEFSVLAGQLYSYSAWVRVDSLTANGQVNISVVLMDSNHTTLNWAYGAVACSLSHGQYAFYSSKFLVPVKGSIRPRIIGNDSCFIYVDDVSLLLTDSIPTQYTHPYTLSNSRLNVTIDPFSFSLSLHSVVGGQTYVTGPSGIFKTNNVMATSDSLAFRCTYVPGNWPCTLSVTLSGPAAVISLNADSASILTNNIEFPGPIPSRPQDNLIIPNGTGVIMPVQNWPAAVDRYRWISLHQWQVDMAFVGVTDLTSGYMITSCDPWFTQIHSYQPSGSLYLAPHVVLESAKNCFAKDRRLIYTVIDTGGYNSMAAWYRTHAEGQGFVKTFLQKAQQVPAINRLPGAVDFWILGTGFWYNKASFFRNLINFGLDRAIFSGNMANAVFDTLNTLGFITSKYDCYCDAYPPGNSGFVSDGYNSDAIVKEDGSYLLGWLAYLDNNQTLQAQEVCAASHCKYAIPRITTERQNLHLNGRFIDVELAIGQQECWSTVHPVNHYADAMARKKLFDTLRTTYNLVLGGEQARDWAFPVVDYGEGTMSFSPVADAGYEWMTPEAPDSDFIDVNMNPAIHIPLHGLAYHDVHIPTWYTGDGVSKVPAYWDVKDLYNILYASMPLFMPPDTGYWRTNFERFLTSYHLVSSVTRSIGFARMTHHNFLTSNRMVQQTLFDNGWNVVVNFDSTASYTLGTRVLLPRGFYATNGSAEAGRLVSGADKIAFAKTADRLFVNSLGTASAYSGIKSSAAVFARLDSARIHLAFIGGQSFVDINPAQLPWPVTGMHVVAESTLTEITPVAQNNGYYRISRLANEAFYRITGTIAVIPSHSVSLPAPRLVISENMLTVYYSLTQPGTMKLEIFDGAGRLLRQIINTKNSSGSFSCPVGRMATSGVCIARITVGGLRNVYRLVIND